VSATASAEGAAYARGVVGFGIPYVAEFGAALEGRVLHQMLSIIGSANARTGFDGAATYTLNAITLRLSVFLDTFLHTWSTLLTSWSAPTVQRVLFSL
jgi:hypothetical protein